MGVFLPHVIYLLSHSPSNEKNETYRSLIKKNKTRNKHKFKSQRSVILLVRFEKRKSIDQGVNLIYLI